MPKRASQKKNARTRQKPSSTTLKGWTAIAGFLAIPVSTAHRWARDGMPVRREARSMVADPEALQSWLGRESHMAGPAQILTDESDLAGAFKQSIAAAKKRSRKG